MSLNGLLKYLNKFYSGLASSSFSFTLLLLMLPAVFKNKC